MTQCLLVDSNAYLRLACHVPNFFGGHPDYELHTLPALNNELDGRRLRSKFIWAGRDPHPALRKKWLLAVKPSQVKQINASKSTVLEFAEETLAAKLPHRRKYDADGYELNFLSPADLTLLCHALHFEHGILTDEYPLTLVAQEYEVPVVTSLELLRAYLDQDLIDMDKVEATVLFWQSNLDVPRTNWTADYKRLFKKKPPTAPRATS
jgi:hypothetical protein